MSKTMSPSRVARVAATPVGGLSEWRVRVTGDDAAAAWHGARLALMSAGVVPGMSDYRKVEAVYRVGGGTVRIGSEARAALQAHVSRRDVSATPVRLLPRRTRRRLARERAASVAPVPVPVAVAPVPVETVPEPVTSASGTCGALTKKGTGCKVRVKAPAVRCRMHTTS